LECARLNASRPMRDRAPFWKRGMRIGIVSLLKSNRLEPSCGGTRVIYCYYFIIPWTRKIVCTQHASSLEDYPNVEKTASVTSHNNSNNVIKIQNTAPRCRLTIIIVIPDPNEIFRSPNLCTFLVARALKKNGKWNDWIWFKHNACALHVPSIRYVRNVSVWTNTFYRSR